MLFRSANIWKDGSQPRNNVVPEDLDRYGWQAEVSLCPHKSGLRIMRYCEGEGPFGGFDRPIFKWCTCCGLLIDSIRCAYRCGVEDMPVIWVGSHLSVNCPYCGRWQRFIPHALAGVIGTRKDRRTINVKGKQRIRILLRDGSRCQLCGVGVDKSELHVDHKKSVHEAQRDGWTESQINADANLWVLCEACNLAKGSTSL